MTDELNQVQEANIDANNDENLFAGIEPEESEAEESTPTNEAEENVAEEPIEATANKPFLEIKYNKETKGLTREEAIELAQKGMNYDHVNDNYVSLRDSLDKLARLNGKDISSYMNSLNDAQIELEADNLMDGLRNKYPNSDDEALKEIAMIRAKENLNLQMQKFDDERKSTADAQRKAVERDVEQFEREFPDVDIANLPEEVKQIIRDDGLNLLSAYYKYLRSEDMKAKSIETAKAKVDKINEENKTKSLGNTTNAGGDNSEVNDFFKGMDSI